MKTHKSESDSDGDSPKGPKEALRPRVHETRGEIRESTKEPQQITHPRDGVEDIATNSSKCATKTPANQGQRVKAATTRPCNVLYNHDTRIQSKGVINICKTNCSSDLTARRGNQKIRLTIGSQHSNR